MFRASRKEQGLPMASYSAYSGSADGSGRGIKMEAPISRAWRNSSGYTKGTYYALAVCLFMMVWGFRQLRYSNSSIWITCHMVECTIQITPPNRGTTTELKVSRRQLVRSDTIKVEKDHTFVRLDSGLQSSQSYRKGKKSKRPTNGPDADGLYNSYTLVLRPPIKNEDQEDESGEFEVDLSSLEEFTYRDGETDNIVIPMRKYNLAKTKRRSKTMSTKLDSYIKQRRHQVTIKENAALSWQGIVAMVLGLFGILFVVLLGQFADEPTKPYTGPGARRNGMKARQNKRVTGGSKFK